MGRIAVVRPQALRPLTGLSNGPQGAEQQFKLVTWTYSTTK